MLRQIFYSFSMLILAMTVFSSCSKNETVSQTEDLSGTWSITGIQSNRAYDWDGDGRQETDILGTYTACDRDIVLSFEQGGFGRISEGCNAPFVNFNWQLSGNRLDMQIPSGDLNLDLLQFNSTTLRGTDNIQVNGDNFQITYTLTRRQRG